MANILTKRKVKKHNKFNRITKKNIWNRKTNKQVGGASSRPMDISVVESRKRKKKTDNNIINTEMTNYSNISERFTTGTEIPKTSTGKIQKFQLRERAKNTS